MRKLTVCRVDDEGGYDDVTDHCFFTTLSQLAEHREELEERAPQEREDAKKPIKRAKKSTKSASRSVTTPLQRN